MTMRMLQLFFFGLSILLFTIQGVQAQKVVDPDIEQEISLEGLYELPLVEIASGIATSLEKAPAVASVITEADIKAMGAITLAQVLESVPGLHPRPSSLVPATPFYMRGLYTTQNPQVLILLNGYRISSDIASGVYPSAARINVKNINRIEIIRGPGSAIYGADAYAGVINIITKTAKDLNGLHVGIRAGSFETKSAWLQYGTQIGKDWSLAFNLEHTREGLDNSRIVNADTQSNLDKLFGTTASLAPGSLNYRYKTTTYNLHVNNKHWSIGIDAWLHRDIGSGAGIGQALDPKGNSNINQILYSLEYQTEDWHPDLKFNAAMSYQRISSQYTHRIFPPGTLVLIGADGNLFTPPFNPVLFTDGIIGNPEREIETPQLDLTFLYDGWVSHTWRLNLGWKKEQIILKENKNFGPGVIDGSQSPIDGRLSNVTGTPYIYGMDGTRNTYYLSLQDVWYLSPDWTLTSGLRYDHYSNFGSTFNPRLSLVWQTSPQLTSKLLYGRAFRAPSFSELYGRNNPIIYGNFNLDPETINTYELAFSYLIRPELRLGLNLYHYQASDMVDLVLDPDGSSTAQNYTDLTGQGLELELDWKINTQWLLHANYAMQKTTNDITNRQLPYLPRQQFYLDARWRFMPDWQLSTQLNWVADRERAADDERDATDDYTLVNLSLWRENFAKHWDFSATINNLFNADVREPSSGLIPDDYPMNKRSMYIGLGYHF
ncbi:TonB-dependent receptor [Candidatus Venteria ishoeyi]|uniref:Vitamin B12 transporter BtuB n=1 Tax=Candidatus Venteria ishoeyi TaxID=1899563 RepID=A0A1H6FDT6_9GAMM|nr:TonB-dependent receptor [Candidatus Venteria ishoeyi]MDM8547095.1 TonB-dependent receptor [Candidatus Venteria ishoeyi]SEH08240.1 Vitamin B12 transporter BtuB precursor [Candidatus Venteria ishoeyi]